MKILHVKNLVALVALGLEWNDMHLQVRLIPCGSCSGLSIVTLVGFMARVRKIKILIPLAGCLHWGVFGLGHCLSGPFRLGLLSSFDLLLGLVLLDLTSEQIEGIHKQVGLDSRKLTDSDANRAYPIGPLGAPDGVDLIEHRLDQ
jgi:hypothetical protein